MIVLRTFNNYLTANITVNKLQDAGVNCFLKDEYSVTIDPLLTNAIGGIKLVVAKNNAAIAMQLLQQFDEDFLQSVKCPTCGATEIVRITKAKPANYATAILTWLFSSYAVAPQSIYQCNNCGYESKTLPNN